MRARTGTWSFVLTILTAFVVVAIGCNTGSKDNPAAGPPPPPPPPPSTPTLTYAVAAIQTNQTSAIVPGNVLGLAFTLTAANGTIDITSITVTAGGSVDESIEWGNNLLVEDSNPANGQVDTAELAAPVATVSSFSTNNGTVSFAPATAISVVPGTPRTFFVVMDGTGVTASTAIVGSNVSLNIAAAADIAATGSGTAVTPGGNFGTGFGPVGLGIHDHLLISEVMSQIGSAATSEEFIEVYNPTGATFDLTNFHITDVDHNQGGAGDTFQYWHLVTDGQGPAGVEFGPPNTNTTTADWHARFPSGTVIAPGEAIIVALDGGGFAGSATYNPPAGTQILVLRNVQAGQTQMLTWDGVSAPPGQFNFSQTALPNSAGLSNTGEPILLFFYDGLGPPALPDLVTDIDYVFYGAAGAARNQPHEKSINGAGTGLPVPLAIDGFDGGAANQTDTTPYAADTTFLTQQANFGTAPSATQSLQRTAAGFTEAGETPNGGNGFGGDDETSENWSTNFGLATPTPGTVP